MTKGIGGQGIASRPGIGRKAVATRFAQQNAQSPTSYPPGSWTFTPPRPGYWKFVLRGHGGGGSGGVTGGASGAYVEVTKYLTSPQSVALIVGSFGGGDTTATFPGGSVATAGAASGAVAGVASGGDVNLNGAAGVPTGGNNGNPGTGTGGGSGGIASGSSGGAGAPANLPFHGSTGASNAIPGPGAGGAEIGAQSNGGHGWAEVVFVKD